MKGPLISVIMPAWNAKATIGAAVLSVVNQQYWNWELIIIDDGSSDDLETELKMFEDNRIRYFRLLKNRGLAGALNVALERAKGRFVAVGWTPTTTWRTFGYPTNASICSLRELPFLEQVRKSLARRPGQ